jgi:hypothetical protein
MTTAFDLNDPSAKAPDDPDWVWTVTQLTETTDGISPPSRQPGQWEPRTKDPAEYQRLLGEAKGLST